MKIIRLLITVLFFIPLGGSAQSLIDEPFNYTPDATNDLVKQSGGNWVLKNAGTPVLVTGGNLSYPGAPASSGNKISFGADAGRYDKSYTPQADGTLYVSFIFRVTALPGTTDGDYFIHFGNGAAGVGAPVYIKASETPGKFNVGLAKRNNKPPAWINKDLDLNVSYYLVFSITYVKDGNKDDVCKLWLDPAPGAEPKQDVSIDDGADFNNFKALKWIVLNHSGDANAGLKMDLDELKVSTQWINLAEAGTPPAPGTLAAAADGSAKINLSWTDNSDNETGFEIERSPDGNIYTSLTNAIANATAYTDTGLTASTKYYYHIRATGPAANSDYSNSANATTTSGVALPAAPGALTALTISSTEISLNWTDNSDNETGFEIERSLDGITFDSLTLVAADITAYTDTGLTSGTTCFYRVRAMGEAGNSDYSDIANATTTVDETAGLIIEPFNYPPDVTNDLSTQSNGVWKAGGDGSLILVTGDNLSYPGLSPSSGNKISIDADAKSYGIDFKGQVDGALYVSFILRVTALPGTTTGDYFIYLGNGGKGIGSPVYLRASETPGKFNIGLSKRNNKTPKWIDKDLALNVSYYVVFSMTYVNGSGNDISRLWLDPASGDEPATDSAVSDGGDFNNFAALMQVVLNHSGDANAGLKMEMDELKVTTKWINLEEVIIPSMPTSLTATANSPTAITLNWTDESDNEAGFEIDRSLNGTDFTLLATVAANTNSYADDGLTALTKYYYRVRATGADGNSDYSDIVFAITSDIVPAAPGTAAAIPDSSTVINLTWTDNSDNETSFEVERSMDGTEFTLLNTVAANTIAYADKGLNPSTTYYYRVRATGISGNSAYSNIVNATTGAAIPTAPGSLEVAAVSANVINLSWTDHSDNETWFEIERSADGNAFILLKTLNPNATTYTDDSLSGSTHYYYRIRATGIAGSSDYSNTADATTAVQPQEKIKAGNALTPNGDGKNDRWIIDHINEYPDNEVSVFDRAGRLIFHARNYTNDWNGTYKGSSLRSGAYIYVIMPGPGIPQVKGILTIIH